jgi:hypothetical protein
MGAPGRTGRSLELGVFGVTSRGLLLTTLDFFLDFGGMNVCKLRFENNSACLTVYDMHANVSRRNQYSDAERGRSMLDMQKRLLSARKMPTITNHGHVLFADDVLRMSHQTGHSMSVQ